MPGLGSFASIIAYFPRRFHHLSDPPDIGRAAADISAGFHNDAYAVGA
jgi:hypothetical protein